MVNDARIINSAYFAGIRAALRDRKSALLAAVEARKTGKQPVRFSVAVGLQV